jgi:hypothetical protein
MSMGKEKSEANAPECPEGQATLMEVRKFFGMTMPEFRVEYMALSTEDREEIRTLVKEEVSA